MTSMAREKARVGSHSVFNKLSFIGCALVTSFLQKSHPIGLAWPDSRVPQEYDAQILHLPDTPTIQTYDPWAVPARSCRVTPTNKGPRTFLVLNN